jgi:hypothetical protein
LVKNVYITSYQGVLANLGYYSGPLSGKLDRATTVALVLYHQAHGLCVSGVPDKATLSNMKVITAG